MSAKTRTGTISSGITTGGVALNSLFGASLAAQYNDYEDVTLVNNSTVDISVASMEGGRAPAAADYKTVPTGGEQKIKRLSSRDFYIKAEAGSYSVEFIGTPA